jgi:hypothetical protein
MEFGQRRITPLRKIYPLVHRLLVGGLGVLYGPSTNFSLAPPRRLDTTGNLKQAQLNGLCEMKTRTHTICTFVGAPIVRVQSPGNCAGRGTGPQMGEGPTTRILILKLQLGL